MLSQFACSSGECGLRPRTGRVHALRTGDTSAWRPGVNAGYSLLQIAALRRKAAMSTTYKPALLKAVVRITSAEKQRSIPLARLGDEFAQLYWSNRRVPLTSGREHQQGARSTSKNSIGFRNAPNSRLLGLAARRSEQPEQRDGANSDDRRPAALSC